MEPFGLTDHRRFSPYEAAANWRRNESGHFIYQNLRFCVVAMSNRRSLINFACGIFTQRLIQFRGLRPSRIASDYSTTRDLNVPPINVIAQGREACIITRP